MLPAVPAPAGLGFASLCSRVLFPSFEDAVDIDDLILIILLQQFEGIHHGFRNEYLNADIPDYSGDSEEDALDVLREGEGHQFEGLTSALDDEELTYEDTDDDDDEEIVVEEVGENIQLIFL